MRIQLKGGLSMFGASLAGAASADVRRIELSVQGMTCASCTARVEKKLNTLEGVLAIVNFATGKASVTVPAWVPVHTLIEEIRPAGPGPASIPRGRAGPSRRSR
jgi:P-type Cu+ transporter